MPNSLAVNMNQMLAEAGFLTPDSYINNTNQDYAQAVAIAQAVALEAVEDNWQVLRKTFTQVLTSATTYTLPTDYLEFISGTAYTQGRWDPIDMATTEPEWALLSSVASVSSLPVRARIIANQLAILNPLSGSTIKIEYTSKNPITDSTGAIPKAQFTADTDLWLIDDRIFQLEAMWRWEKKKGIDGWEFTLQEAASRRASVRGRDTAQGTITPNQITVTGQPYVNTWAR